MHKLLDFTVERLREHSHAVSRLLAEKQTRERELEWTARLEESARLEALGRLAGGVAHDFNNLLTALIGCAELAEHKLITDPMAAARALRDVQTAAERGASLTAQLLDFASRRPAQPRNVDLNELVTAAGQLLNGLLKDSIELSIHKSSEPCCVCLDPGCLERVLLNLATNARDAMPNGGKLLISVSKIGTRGRAQLEVRDTGEGIAASDLAHIFEPFFTRKERGKGTGLGLASVYGIVKQSGGEIEAESTLGAGTCFRMQWPLVSAGAPATANERRTPVRGKETILLVDDDEAVRGVSLALLEEAGYSVLCAASGQEALALLAQSKHQPDLLLTDVSMPGMSGLELAQAVLAQAPHLPVLLISGYAEELANGPAGAITDARFLAKPFSGARLAGEVRRAIDAARERAQL